MAAGWTGRLRGMQDGGVRKNATAWTFKRTLERDERWSVKMKGAKARVWRLSGRMQERYEWRKITK